MTINNIGYLRKFRRLWRSLFEPWKPDSVTIMVWKMVILCLMFIQCFFSTYIIAFLPSSDRDFDEPIVLIDIIIDVIYAIDIFLNFRIAFYHQGELCLESSEIARNYIKSYFVFDLISMLSIIGRISLNNPLRVLVLVVLLRIVHLPQLLAKIEDYFQFSRQISSLYQLGKLVMAIILFAHWCGCILYSIARVETGPTWITAAGLNSNDLDEIYVACLYWAIATMATIGYGDIHPTTFKERIISITIMIASSIIFGYILSSIGALLLEINAFNTAQR